MIARLQPIVLPVVLTALGCAGFVLYTCVRALTVAAPDLLLLLVVAVAVVRGPAYGAVLGFCCGLLVDLAPGSAHAAGVAALANALAGFAAGLVNEAGKAESRRLWFPIVLLTAIVVAFGAFTGMAAVLDERRFSAHAVLAEAGTAAASTLLLGLFAVPLLAGVLRKWA